MNRQGFIGGSDCTTIMQGDWFDLWQIKTGRVDAPQLDDNLAVQMGITTEPLNLRWFERHYGCKLERKQRIYEKTIGRVFARGTIDGAWVDQNALVEAKHTNTFNTLESMIEYYNPQIQLYLQLSNLDKCYLSAFFGNNKWECSYVGRDDKYFKSMWAVVSDFWGYVERDQEPIGFEIPTFNPDEIKIDDMVKRNANKDNEFMDAANRWLENKDAAKAYDNANKDLKGMVVPSEREVYCDLLSVRRDKRGHLRIYETKNGGK